MADWQNPNSRHLAPGAFTEGRQLLSRGLTGSKTLVVADDELLVLKQAFLGDDVHRIPMSHCDHLSLTSRPQWGVITTVLVLLGTPGSLLCLAGWTRGAIDRDLFFIIGGILLAMTAAMLVTCIKQRKQTLRFHTARFTHPGVKVTFSATNKATRTFLDQLVEHVRRHQATARQLAGMV